MLKSEIKIIGQKEKYDLTYQVLMSDIVSTDRVKITISTEDNLKIDFAAQDITSLRAAINTISRQIKLIEDTIEVCDNYDRK